MKIQFSKRVRKDVKKLDHQLQKRIKEKLLWFAKQDDPLSFAESLTEHQMGQYRFRVGDYRIIFDVVDDCIEVHKIDHRDSIY